jgi:integrase
MKPETEIIGPVQGQGVDIVPLPSLVRDYIRASKAENTLRGYESDWRDFCGWCEARNVAALPANPETVASYIADCATRLKVGSVQRRLNSITEAHKALGLESPTHSPMVANTMKGIRRTKGTAPIQKAPALTDDIRAMVNATDPGVIGLRDRALILLGFASAFRRSELVELDFEDCTFGKDGLTITLGDLKQINRGKVGRSAYPTDQILKPVQSETLNRGWNYRASALGLYSVRSVGTATSRRDVCPVSTWRES